jgi:hypothetical protein
LQRHGVAFQPGGVQLGSMLAVGFGVMIATLKFLLS